MDYGIFQTYRVGAEIIYLPFFQLFSTVWLPKSRGRPYRAAYRFNELPVSYPQLNVFCQSNAILPIDAGINDGDLLVVDSSRTAEHGDIVIAARM